MLSVGLTVITVSSMSTEKGSHAGNFEKLKQSVGGIPYRHKEKMQSVQTADKIKQSRHSVR